MTTLSMNPVPTSAPPADSCAGRLRTPRSLHRVTRLLVVVLAPLALVHCGGGASGSSSEETATTSLSPTAALGKKIFDDTALSASGQQSCGTCHVATQASSATDGLSVPLGGVAMDLPGFRNAPSLRYVSYTPAFQLQNDGAPLGGFFRDGRSPSLSDQAQRPFLGEFEMANASSAEVVAKLKTRPYLGDFIAIYGADVLNDPDTALARMGAAIATYESEDTQFRPFNSKYDFWVKGQVALTTQELNGLALYNNPAKGNCAACHPTTPFSATVPALFTDFSYDNLGVPRNASVAANDNDTTLGYVPSNSTDGLHGYYDLGLCGPLNEPIAGRNDLCGTFKVPTLRNIALTAPYFHNGIYATLQQALSFYVTRDTNPELWYPLNADGSVTKFDDLPEQYGGQFNVIPAQVGSDGIYYGNVNTAEVPYNRHIGDEPALSSAEITEVIAFLCTLTDGFDLSNPSAYALPAQCPQSLN